MSGTVRGSHIAQGAGVLLWEILCESHHCHLKSPALKVIREVREVRLQSLLGHGEAFLGVEVTPFCWVLKTTQWNSEPCAWVWIGMSVEQSV